jgi:2-polyprenyl-6-methoxyphenol hydroxylase-like FAD-dependent oxidoreductase
MEKISIVGGGIAGLALSACLDPDKFQVTIHEKRPELPTVGTVLAMWPNAQRALEKVGILEQAQAVGPVIGSGSVRDASGRPWITVKGGDMFGISRTNLLRLLDSAVPASVERRTGTVASIPTDAGLVVGADGVHSVIRREAWGGGTEARLTPYIAVRGMIPSQVEQQEVGEYWGRGDLFGVANASSGINWYGSYRSELGPAEIDVAAALQHTRHHFSAHAPVIRRILAEASPENTLAQRIWTTPRLRSYVRGNVALIGDAAHAMTPNLGRGACEALVDAVALADLLNTLPEDQALRAYNRRRRIPTQALRLSSSVLMRVALAERAQPLRDRLLSLARRRNPPAAVGSRSPA